MADHDPLVPQGAMSIGLAVLTGIGILLFFVGTSASDYDFETPLGEYHEEHHPDVPPAPSYTAMRTAPKGASSGFDADLATLVVPTGDGGSVGDALRDRAALRAYDGAPPRIPHAIRQDAAPECLSCHDEGLTIRGKQALPMSHRELTSCTQCHVVAQAPMPGGDALPTDPRDVPNSFAGMASPDHGPRAWSIAPPQVPHTAFMRERCMSCHGEMGRAALRTPHTQRANCEQCHAPSATVSQRPGVPR